MKSKKRKKSAKKKCWEVFSKYIRLMYSDNGVCQCVTCGKKDLMKNMHCGHYVGGRNNTVLLDERLCYVQCPRCNIMLSGNYSRFTLFMLSKGYTQEELEGFLNLAKETKPFEP